jgi:hypothetical protein
MLSLPIDVIVLTAGGRLGAGTVPTVAAGAKVESKPPVHGTVMGPSMSGSVGRMDAGTGTAESQRVAVAMGM